MPDRTFKIRDRIVVTAGRHADRHGEITALPGGPETDQLLYLHHGEARITLDALPGADAALLVVFQKDLRPE